MNIGIVLYRGKRRSLRQPFLDAHIKYLPGKATVFHCRGINRIFNYKFIAASLFTGFRLKLLNDLWGYFIKKVSRQEVDFFPFLFSEEKIDVLLAEFGHTGSYIKYSAQNAGIPLVVHFHGIDAYTNMFEGFHVRYKEMFSIAKAVVVVSQDMAKQVEALGAPHEKIYYNPYGVNTSFFSGAQPSNAPPIFLGVARFVEKKGHIFSLLAFKKILERHPQARLVLVGDGPLRKSCILLAKKLDMAHAVKFTGMLSYPAVAQYMRKARAFIQHSICAEDGNAEGMPFSILEAGSCGLPVVATKHKGITEAVIHGQTGFLVEEKDVKGMSEHMETLINDPLLAGQLGANARARIIQNYSQEKSIESLFQILVEVRESRD